MKVRQATAGDLERCQRLDGSYGTNAVWQMSESVAADTIGVSFRRVRVPRRVSVAYPRDLGDLYEDWRRDECFLVAYDFATVMGFVLMTLQPQQRHGWIKHLIVGPAHRRQGVATLLLDTLSESARRSNVQGITAIVESRNDPAIQLLARRGYGFRGFIDHHFGNEMGLLYTLHL